MELLVTLIGNAAVDSNFRKEFLEDPVKTTKKYGFRLTKGDYQIMTTVFRREDFGALDEAFKKLEDKLYYRLELPPKGVPPERPPCTSRPCIHSIYTMDVAA